MMKPTIQVHRLGDVEHWQARADEARATAETFSDPSARASMLEIARQYEFLALCAEKHRAREKRDEKK